MRMPAPDKVTMMEVVMAALIADGASPAGDLDEVGTARIVAVESGRVAGIAVAKEAFARMGVRLRPFVDDAAGVDASTPVAELGGPLGSDACGRPDGAPLPGTAVRDRRRDRTSRPRGTARRVGRRPRAVVASRLGGPR